MRAMRMQGVRALARSGSEVRREVQQYNQQLWGELRTMRPHVLSSACLPVGGKR